MIAMMWCDVIFVRLDIYITVTSRSRSSSVWSCEVAAAVDPVFGPVQQLQQVAFMIDGQQIDPYTKLYRPDLRIFRKKNVV